VGAQGDPYFFTSMNQFVSCCKSFIVMISSGQPSQDANNNPNPAPFGTLFNSSPDTIGLSSTRLDDVALYGQTHDIRNQPAGTLGALSGTQNVTFYAVNAMGGAAGAGVLASAAKFGGFLDRDGNGLPNATGQSCTYPAGSSLGSGTGTSSPEWDVDQDCVPDTYFDASDGGDLQAQINNAIVSILKRAASGTAVSVLASSTTGEGAVYQAYFFPATTKAVDASESTVTWTGYLQGLFVDKYGNLREDYSGPGCTGPPDGKLVLKHDCIVKVRLDPITNIVWVDRYKDDNGDGMADDVNGDGVIDKNDQFGPSVPLQELQPIWEAGARLALTDPGDVCPADTGGVTCRRLLTWVDINNDGLATAGEQIEFTANTAADVARLCPYLGNVKTSDGLGNNPSATMCDLTTVANQVASQNAAANVINFIRGRQVATLRDRQLSLKDDAGAQTIKVWKLGDIISSTPVVVGAPRERYDVIYGDATYSAFFQRYKDRRQVSYVGANDGMLHAFNAGFYTVGDDTSTIGVIEQVRFTTTPKQPGTSTNCASLPCDGSAATYPYRSNNPKLGAELWGFIPQDLLPHLQWLTDPNYAHVYYVDLKPKVTDARIFANDADHPGGWGTILIGGFRLGGSCRNCQSEGLPFTVAAPFGGMASGEYVGQKSRVFLSSYFVLDITNPEKDPVLLWTFRDMDLGFTTSMPAVARVNPALDAKTSSANEKWYVVFGTGPTGYQGVADQSAKFFVIDLKLGPAYSAVNQATGTVNGHTCTVLQPCIAVGSGTGGQQVQIFDTGQQIAFMGDVVTVDLNLDFKVDVIYAGTVICNGVVYAMNCNVSTAPTWKGVMYRLTTNGGNTNPGTWGVAAAPTVLTSTFAYTSPQATTCSNASPCKVGPITSAPALTTDTNNNLWVMFGTGRFYSTLDGNTSDIQHLFGVKDSFMTLGSPVQTTERNNLYNVSNVAVCTSCASSANVSYGGAGNTGGFDTGANNLVGNIQNADGWFMALPSAGERSLSTATLFGGSLYFTTFVPSADICAGSGTGYLYGLYFLTGTPNTSSALGITTGPTYSTASRSISLGGGLPSNLAMQLGGQGAGGGGTTSSTGCKGRATGFIQTSSGALQQVCSPAAAGQPWSRVLTWRDL
jgi:type IV pilus assembly protein PilY1